MFEKYKKTIKLFIPIWIIFGILFVSGIVYEIWYFIKWNNTPDYEYTQRDLMYYDKIKTKIKNGEKTIVLADIFDDFEWDCVYIQGPGDGTNTYDAVLGYETGVEPLKIEIGSPYHMLFSNDNEIAYIFMYDRALYFGINDELVYKQDAVFILQAYFMGGISLALQN